MLADKLVYAVDMVERICIHADLLDKAMFTKASYVNKLEVRGCVYTVYATIGHCFIVFVVYYV